MPTRYSNKISIPTPATSKAEMYFGVDSNGYPGILAKNDGGVIASLGLFGLANRKLIKVTHIFQGTTTYTPDTNATLLVVECWGAGGGGGSSAASSTFATSGSGGGGGAYSTKIVSSNVGGTHNVIVGAGGAGGAGGSGGAGNDTEFRDNTNVVVCLAKGGNGGNGGVPAALPRIGGEAAAGGAAASGTGDVKQSGAPSDAGYELTTAQTVSGRGGVGAFGNGGGNSLKTTAVGLTAAGYSGGGGGGNALTGQADQAGGTGANGIIRVWEFL